MPADFRPETSDVQVSAIVLDIEGTTTPIAFVYDVLFPYARAHLPGYLDDPANAAALAEPLRLLQEERSRESAVDSPPETGHHVREYIAWLMDRDRKSPGLKLLQGQIWERGYRTGELKGQVFPDVAPALRRWKGAGIDIAIYSSGSVLAQRLLFGSTTDGDLTPLLSQFFDTGVGPKTSSDSYTRIARDLGRQPREVLFVSDVIAELGAAKAAGCQVLLCVRPGNKPQPAHHHSIIDTFEDIDQPRKHENTKSQ